MNSFEAFMAGIKPGCLCHHEEDCFFLQKLTGFPNVQIRNDLTLVFQNEEQKNQFLIQSEDIEPGSAEHHRIIGLALGYPPMAADFFARSWIDRSLWDESVTFHYHGYLFSGHKDDAQAISEWLWSNVPVPPSSVKVTKINGETFFVHPKP